MIPLRSAFTAIFLGGAVAWSAGPPAREWILPPLDGELSGEFDALMLGGAPKLSWKLSLRTEMPRERKVEFLIEGRGVRIRGDARLDPIGEGFWRIAEAAIDLGEWYGWLAPRLSADAAGVSCAGALELTGEGTWRAGTLGGKASLSLREGRLDDSVRKIRLEGISVDFELDDLVARRTKPAQVFTWRSGQYDVVALGVGRIEFEMDAEQISVTKAAIDVFGGELSVGSLVMSTSRPEFAVTAQMSGVAVDQIMFLLPPVLAEAHGKLDGRLNLRRDAAGIQIGTGRLALREGETADLRLSPSTTSLSANLPPSVQKLYPGLLKMETGGLALRAHLLEVTFTPQGDAEGRTASVHLAGGPSDPALQAPIDLTVNVNGPLESLVKFGTNSRLRFGGAR